MLTSYLTKVRRQWKSKLPVNFQVITVNFLFVLNTCKAECQRGFFYFISNRIIKLNMVLPPFWLFGLFFDEKDMCKMVLILGFAFDPWSHIPRYDPVIDMVFRHVFSGTIPFHSRRYYSNKSNLIEQKTGNAQIFYYKFRSFLFDEGDILINPSSQTVRQGRNRLLRWSQNYNLRKKNPKEHLQLLYSNLIQYNVFCC